MKKILKIIPFGESGSELYCVMVCDIGEYRVFKKFDYFSNSVIVSALNGCKAGDIVEIKKYYDLSDFSNVVYEIAKVRKD